MKSFFRLSFVAAIFGVVLFSCDDKEEKVILPELSTTAVTDITTTGAVSGGNVTADGGAEVTECGVCWGTVSNPTVSGNKAIADGKGIGTFSVSLVGLTPDTEYFVRAYAINSVGTAYGNEVSFITAEPNIKVENEAALNQILYADEQNGKSVKILTTGAWTSTISERTAQSSSVTWISIYPYSGDKAGEYTVEIALPTNTTGEDRTAVITLTCNSESITITITQKGRIANEPLI